MRALNLYSLTRIRDSENVSRLSQAMSGRSWQKTYSQHEVASLCALVDGLAKAFRQTDPAGDRDWVSYFDGFYFSYTIEHISKEFDLLKLSADGSCALNIELKSEPVEEERIRRQLEQNRYYLSHISRTILSYTYVMETDVLYCLNDHGYLKKSSFSELAMAMQRPILQEYAEEDIGRFFRAQDYLISPVLEPEKFLAGRYFLTNQQADFRGQILEALEAYRSSRQAPGRENLRHSAGGLPEDEKAAAGRSGDWEGRGSVPVVSLTGNAGTGKTLLVYDLAMELSRRRDVLLLYGGPLGEGHRVIDGRLRKVKILSGTQMQDLKLAAPGKPIPWCIMIDEANRLSSKVLESVLEQAEAEGIPCILSFDPHSILETVPLMEQAEAVISRYETMHLEMSGNIRINRPVFSFLRTLFHRKDRAGNMDYGCIDVLYAENQEEEYNLKAHYLSMGYVYIDAAPEAFRTGTVINQEYDRVLMVLDRHFYYDDALHLRTDSGSGDAIPPLYEGLSRTREKLCLIIVGNRELFSQILAIRTA